MRRTAAALLVLLGMIGLIGAQAARAAPACVAPAGLDVPHVEGPSAREPQRLLPIGSYTLAMFWMPQACRTDAASCALHRQTRGGGRGDGLALHGLWPDGRGREWPQWCAAAAPLPARTIAAHVCATPSPQLLQHEWTKHGTCMAGYTPERYFAVSNRLFAAVRAPNLRALSYRPQSAASIGRAFARANPGMPAGAVRLNLDRQGWLQEIWLCLDTQFRPQRCPATQGGARAGERVRIWRSTGRG